MLCTAGVVCRWVTVGTSERDPQSRLVSVLELLSEVVTGLNCTSALWQLQAEPLSNCPVVAFRPLSCVLVPWFSAVRSVSDLALGALRENSIILALRATMVSKSTHWFKMLSFAVK